MALNNILIAVPTMGGVIKAKTASTLVLLMRQLTRAGVTAEYLTIDAADIVYARNVFARVVLESKRLDGLLFVDSDMAFRPLLVLKMIRLDTDVVAAAYPRRELDLGRFARAAGKADGFSAEAMAKAMSGSLQYTVIPSWDSPKADKLMLRGGFAKMAGAGMGCTLISRSALQAMVDGEVVSQRKDVLKGVEQVGWGFFDPLTVGGVTLSEDFSFCYRWTRLLGRDLWVNIDEEIAHLGEFSYQSRYLDHLKVLPPKTPPDKSPPESADIDPDMDGVLDAPS